MKRNKVASILVVLETIVVSVKIAVEPIVPVPSVPGVAVP
jgi:hypothetical protein